MLWIDEIVLIDVEFDFQVCCQGVVRGQFFCDVLCGFFGEFVVMVQLCEFGEFDFGYCLQFFLFFCDEGVFVVMLIVY